MKKFVITCIIFLCLPMLGFAASTMLTDSEMDEVVGQAGVTLSFEDLFITADLEGVSWGDNDGYASGPADAGRIRIDGDFGARISMPGSSEISIDVSAPHGVVFGLSNNLTIDVDIAPVMKLSVLPGADPEFTTVDPTTDQVIGYLQLNNPVCGFIPSTVYGFKPH